MRKEIEKEVMHDNVIWVWLVSNDGPLWYYGKKFSHPHISRFSP
jgi:hypothetical protein